ncbi:dihydrofolate reductase-like domain-containing protein [Fennellomyces sp. T-0311]|nr:dihydrofolate reductase-like domain-containing protein [Fennellomyces sp. T-0311]
MRFYPSLKQIARHGFRYPFCPIMTVGDTPIVLMAAALASSWGIGKDQDLPWSIPVDSAYLEQITTKPYTVGSTNDWHNVVVMGRLSWESVPMKKIPMPRRFNVVISRDPSYKLGVFPNASLATSIHEGLEQAKQRTQQSQGRIFVLGGGEIYQQSMRLCTHILLTRIYDHTNGITCDAFMPPVDLSLFTQASHQELESFVQQAVPQGRQACNDLEYEFLLYVRNQ